MRKSETLDEMLDQAYATVQRAKEREELLDAMAFALRLWSSVELKATHEVVCGLCSDAADQAHEIEHRPDCLLARYRALRGKEGA
jgi:hypothetical protein